MPLANDIRPLEFSEVFNQDHLIGENGVITRMLNTKLNSFILSGGPGTGKTTIATIVANKHGNSFTFNASTDKKTDLVKIIEENKPLLLIVDEIHRMKTDTQDYLLKYLENGEVVMIGLTTHNPYFKVNPAIRSRCLLLKLNELTKNDIVLILKDALKKINFKYQVDIEALSYIAQVFSNEARSSLNFLELVTNLSTDITLELVSSLSVDPNVKLDSNDDYHYQLLSGLQKSIRGSDLDASLYYTAKLLIMGDTASLTRRLLVIAYEDISLANPELLARVSIALNSAEIVGLPEARIMYANVVTELALSPKSNAAYVGLDNALNKIKNESLDYEIPIHLKNEKLYKYPHNYKFAMVKQSYLPDEIKNEVFAEFKGDSAKEMEYKERYLNIKKIIRQ